MRLSGPSVARRARSGVVRYASVRTVVSPVGGAISLSAFACPVLPPRCMSRNRAAPRSTLARQARMQAMGWDACAHRGLAGFHRTGCRLSGLLFGRGRNVRAASRSGRLGSRLRCAPGCRRVALIIAFTREDEGNGEVPPSSGCGLEDQADVKIGGWRNPRRGHRRAGRVMPRLRMSACCRQPRGSRLRFRSGRKPRAYLPIAG